MKAKALISSHSFSKVFVLSPFLIYYLLLLYYFLLLIFFVYFCAYHQVKNLFAMSLWGKKVFFWSLGAPAKHSTVRKCALSRQKKDHHTTQALLRLFVHFSSSHWWNNTVSFEGLLAFGVWGWYGKVGLGTVGGGVMLWCCHLGPGTPQTPVCVLVTTFQHRSSQKKDFLCEAEVFHLQRDPLVRLALFPTSQGVCCVSVCFSLCVCAYVRACVYACGWVGGFISFLRPSFIQSQKRLRLC